MVMSFDEWYEKKNKKKAEGENKWFQKGAFNDGYQFGDITKTVVGTAADINENINAAVLDATENLVDTVAYGVGAFGGKDFKDKVKNFIAKETFKPNEAGKVISDYATPFGWTNALVNKGDTEENSLLGNKSDGLVQSAAHMVGSQALGLINPALTQLSMGVNSFGSEIESAFQQDASYAEAGISGAITTAAELLFEKLSKANQIFKGGSADSTLVKKLSSKISNKLVKTLLNFGLDVVEEGTEEVLTEVVSAAGRKFTYLDEKEWNEVLNKENLWDAFIGGVVMGGTFNVAGSAIQNGQYAKVGKSVTDADLGVLVDFANKSDDTDLLSLAEDIANSEKVSNKDKGKLAANVQQSIFKTMDSAKTADALIDVYNNLTTNQSGYIISLANQVFVNKAAKVNLDPSVMMNTMKTVDGTVVSTDKENVNDINRSDNNAGQDPGILAGSGVSTVSGSGNSLRQQGENSAKIQGNMGYASETERNNDILSEGGGSAWLSGGNDKLSKENRGRPRESFFRALRDKQPSGIDAKGRVVSAQNQKRLAETVFKTDEGHIIVLYHWTPNKFDEFKYGDGAFHAGTVTAALSVKAKNEKKVGGYLKEVYVISKHPLIIKDVGRFGAYAITEQLQDMGLLDDETYKKITRMDGFFSDKYEAEANVYLREYLKALGFDSYLYRNTNEGTGAWSVGVFDADQIITIAENGVLKENSGVTEADSDESASFTPESDSGITELSAENPKYDMIEDLAAEMAGTIRKTDQQRLLVKIGKAFGAPVKFANLDETIVDESGNEKLFSPDGEFNEDTGVITLNTSTAVKHNPVKFVLKHELVHFGNTNKKAYDTFVKAVIKSKVFEQWLKQKTNMQGATVDVMLAKLNNDVREQRARAGKPIGPEIAYEEIIANFSGDVLFEKSGKPITELIESLQKPQRPLVLQYIVNAFEHLIGKLKGTNDGLTLELRNLQSNYVHMLKQAQKNTTTQNSGGVKNSFMGYSKDGKGKYKSNFPKGTPKSAKGEKILKYIQNVWSKKPIRLKIVENGVTKYIEAKFDPTYDESGNIPTDASKLMGGNRHGTSSEQRVTLDLADDYYQIASESQYNYSKDETGKDSFAHQDVSKWHYFINDIYFAEYDGEKYEPYRVSINVKEKNDGEYVYSFSAEKQRESNTPRTLHAVVNEGEIPNANVELSNNRVAQNQPIVNTQSMQKKQKYSVSTESTDTTDYTAEMDALYEQFRNGEIDRDDYIAGINELYEKAGETYGTIKKGEKVTGNENFDDPTPKKVNPRQKVRRFVRTIIEGGNLTDEMLTVTKQQVLSGDVSYTPTSNEKNLKYAEKAILKGAAKGIWEKAINGEEKPSGGVIAIGEVLLKNAVEAKDTVQVVQLTAELSEMATRLGQAIQAFRLLKQLDGISQLYYVQKTVDRLNQDLAKKHGNKAPVVTINPDLALQLAESKTKGDFDISYNAIMQDIAAQVPSTFLDKYNAWRYMSMLFNPTTHVRNVLGNAIFVPAIRITYTLAALTEAATGVSTDKRTKAVIVGKEYKNFAKDDFANVEEIITGGGKMNPTRSIADNKTIFKNKILESARKFNFDMLEKEDAIFLKGHYVRALSGYLQAQKVNLKNVPADVLAKAREYAILEAQKATYRDTSALANIVSNLSQKNAVANILVEGMLPFKKTPINIVKRGIEYSPLGLIKTLTKGIYDLKTGGISSAQFIDGIAGGLTGTAIMALGMALASLGVIKGGFDDDEEDWFNKLMGHQEYSVEIGGVSYTIDWAAPACMPLFIGVAAMESIMQEDNANVFSSLSNAFGAGLEPFINLSMLSGIQDTIATTRYSDADEMAQSIIGNMVGSYFSQTLPTLGSKINNIIDPVRRSNYIDKTSPLPKWVQSSLNTLGSKVPGLSKYKAEYVDAWGNKQYKGGFVERVFQNFLSPGYLSDVETSAVADEIKRLAKETGEDSVYPSTPQKYIKFKNTTKHLTADEYTRYAIDKGQMSAEYIKEAVNSEKYKKLTDEQKVKVITNLYKYANAKAKANLSYSYEEINAMHDGNISQSKFSSYKDQTKKGLVVDYFLDDYKKAYSSERNGGSAVNYFITKAKQ